MRLVDDYSLNKFSFQGWKLVAVEIFILFGKDPFLP